MPNVCQVKYLSAKIRELHSVETLNIDSFLIQKIEIEHSTYKELHCKVLGACPVGYLCMEPIALYHEVRVAGPAARGLYAKHVEDQLHHAIEEGEYAGLWPSLKPITVCVHVQKL